MLIFVHFQNVVLTIIFFFISKASETMKGRVSAFHIDYNFFDWTKSYFIIHLVAQDKLFSSKNRMEASVGKKLKIDLLPDIEKDHKVLYFCVCLLTLSCNGWWDWENWAILIVKNSYSCSVFGYLNLGLMKHLIMFVNW